MTNSKAKLITKSILADKRNYFILATLLRLNYVVFKHNRFVWL